jgi:hypothetical protein
MVYSIKTLEKRVEISIAAEKLPLSRRDVRKKATAPRRDGL